MESLLAPLKVSWKAFVTWWEDSIPLLFLNLLWLLCLVTIILGPPATFGMFHLTAELVEGYTVTPREMYVGAKKYFVKSWAWMLANLLVVSILASNLSFYWQIEAAWGTYVFVFMFVLLLFWLMVQFYTVPFLILQDDKSLKQAWKNGLLTTLASPFFTFVMFLDIVLVLVLTVVTIFPLVLGSGVMLVILGNTAVKERLETFNSMIVESNGDEESGAGDTGEESG